MEAVAIASDRNTCTIDQVAGVITSGIASPTLVLVHRKSPARLSFHGSRSVGPVVIGRACSTNSSSPSAAPLDVHRRAVELLDPYAQRGQPLGLGRSGWPALAVVGTGTSAVPSPCARHDRLGLTTRRTTRPEPRSTVKVSGVTWPPTTASPRPQAALISITLGRR